MRIGEPQTPAPQTSAHYQSPAEELHEQVLVAFEDANILTRLALAESLERRTRWAALPQSVRTLFESVVVGMGISD